MRPQLERMHHPTGYFALDSQFSGLILKKCFFLVMECLRKSLIFVSDNLEWDYENMPTTIENIKKHPGIPIATGLFVCLVIMNGKLTQMKFLEVAKCMSFGDLYDVIIRVITKVHFIYFFYFLISTQIHLKSWSLERKEDLTSVNQSSDYDLKMSLKNRVHLLFPFSFFPFFSLFPFNLEQFLHIREFRVLFGLAPEAYDRYHFFCGKVNEGKRERKNMRKLTFFFILGKENLLMECQKKVVHTVLLHLSFLFLSCGFFLIFFSLFVEIFCFLCEREQGLYEARGKHFDLELSVDALFRSRTEEVKEAREGNKKTKRKYV